MTDSDLGRLRALLDHTIERGEARLPPEPRLSETLGVSRGRLRTLLKKLEDEGAIWRHVGKGTFVGPRQMIETPQLSASFSVDDILQARTLLEPQLAAQAAIHATPEDLALMQACLKDMDQSESLLSWKRLDERLHRIIAQASHNMLLLLLYDTLRAQIRMTLDRRIEQVFGGEVGPKEDTDEQHRAVVDAIERHDPVAAETCMRTHLVSLRGKLFGLR
ncbi:MAG: FadR family transcriptional regulator [Sphingobium sp.]|uniref:FadR/GntR family transcriptional regulator n=1 Tax=Sphingobium sp. TaxID=1912891 RepID=UPI001A1EC2C1|nr:FCD domain-containing protein [Sphingobium sp.]MBJ7442717.1 FadR family transcriptional regulator [Sphingobium sp.]